MLDANRAKKIGVTVSGKRWLLPFFLAILTLRLLPAQSSPEIPAYMYSVINDAGRMSIAAYGNDKELFETLRQEGWGTPLQIDFPSGLHVAVWDRNLSDGNTERIVAFVGTKDIAGVAADLAQGLVGPKMTAQYRDGLDFALKQVAEKDQNPHLSVTFTGHSLGGGIAEQVNLETGVRAVVFNAAPLNGMDALLDKSRSGQASVAEIDLWNFRTKGDIVSALPLANQYGRTFAFDTVRPTTGQWAGDYSTHGVEALLDSVSATRTKSAVRAVSSPTNSQSTNLAASSFAAVDVAGLSGNLNRTAKTFDLGEAVVDMKVKNPLLPYRLGAASQALSLSGAVLSDIDESRNRNFNLFQSHTLEQFGTGGIWGLGTLSNNLSDAGETIGRNWRVSQIFARGMSFAGAAADIGTDLLKFSLSPGSQSGRTSLTDGLTKGTPYLVGYAFSRPLIVAAAGVTGVAEGAAAATVAYTAINLAAEPLRVWTAPLFVDSATRAKIADMYHDYTLSQAARGQPSVSFEDWLNPTRTRDAYSIETPVTSSRFAFTAASGHFINGTSAFSQTYTFHSNDPLSLAVTTHTSTSYTESFNGFQANQSIQRALGNSIDRRPTDSDPPVAIPDRKEWEPTVIKRPPSASIPPPPRPDPVLIATGANPDLGDRSGQAFRAILPPLPSPSQPEAIGNNGRRSIQQPQVGGVLLAVTEQKASKSTDKANYGSMFLSSEKSQASRPPDANLVATVFNKKSEDEEFEHDRSLGTSSAMEAYLGEFPSGRHINEAHTLDESLAYQEASVADSIVAMETFVARFPSGKFTSHVAARLRELRFKRAQQSADIELCKQFLIQYPDGKDSDELRQYLSSILK